MENDSAAAVETKPSFVVKHRNKLIGAVALAVVVVVAITLGLYFGLLDAELVSGIPIAGTLFEKDPWVKDPPGSWFPKVATWVPLEAPTLENAKAAANKLGYTRFSLYDKQRDGAWMGNTGEPVYKHPVGTPGLFDIYTLTSV
jgi:hypothetical protein